MRALNYFFEEAFASMWRGRRSGLLSVATIAIAVFVLGGFLLFTANLERLLARWSSAAEFSVYLRDDVAEPDRAAIEAVLSGSPAVASHELVSKASALARFQRDFPDLAAAAGEMSENPFPASFDVRLRPEQQATEAVDALAAKLGKMAGVADVRYDRRWIARLLAAVALVRGVGVVLASILVVAAALTVANVVRLALVARRDEIEIMELVGSPMAYIRGPFVVEGILQGGLGALMAVAVLWGVFVAGRARYGTALVDVIEPSMIGFLPLQLCGLLLAGGMAVGCLGGLVASRRVS